MFGKMKHVFMSLTFEYNCIGSSLKNGVGSGTVGVNFEQKKRK